MPTKKSSKAKPQNPHSLPGEVGCNKENGWCSLHCVCRFFSPSENIVYNGFLLIIINTFLILALGILSLVLFIFFPLLIILIGTLSIAIWYQFGAEIYRQDKEHHIINALFSVLIGLVPLLFLSLVYEVMIFGTGFSAGFSGMLIAMMTTLSMILMPIVVVMGSITDFIFHE